MKLQSGLFEHEKPEFPPSKAFSIVYLNAVLLVITLTIPTIYYVVDSKSSYIYEFIFIIES